MRVNITSLVAIIISLAEIATGWNVVPVVVKNQRSHVSSPSSSMSLVVRKAAGKSNAADDLQDQARKLREEIDAFEKQKTDQEEAEKKAVREEKRAVQKAKDYYCAVVPILKPDGSTQMEKVEFKPISQKQDTKIVVLEGVLPLGMILEEGDVGGTTIVEEVATDSNAEIAGVQKGDYLRACTACEMNMEAPTWQLLAGGIGVPKTKRMMYVVDNRPFEEVMDAIGSNRMDPEGRPVVLVVERKR